MPLLRAFSRGAFVRSRRTIAIIPARGGSSRIKRKNARRLGTLTLVQHAARAALHEGLDAIVVSTDDPAIACGLEYVRQPDELSGPDCDISAAVRWALIEAEKKYGDRFDDVITLQPSILCRPRGFIAAMLDEKDRRGAVAALTVVPTVPWLWAIDGPVARNGWSPGAYPRSQAFEKSGKLNVQEINAVQIADRNVVLASMRWTPPLLLCELPTWASVDIDYPEDLELARKMWPMLQKLMDEPVNEIKTHLITMINPQEAS